MTTKRKIAKITESEDHNVITFDFDAQGKVDAVIDQLPKSIVGQILVYGLKQKVQDGYSGKDQKEAALSAVETIKQLMEGTWTNRRAGGGTSFTLVVLALGRAMSTPDKVVSEAEAQAMFDKLDEDIQDGLAKHAEIVPHIEVIRAERAAKRAKDAIAKTEGMERTLGAVLGA